ncbi:Vacuolar calcium ion transporter [Cyphellophora attinorum]|uniref:Vacuolar calcium ion transporter n=1 Tax=Cyphellophora attinorum TaxID=1664694 RepID=A0A0N1HFA2_9EURO|nr:Vacuolar calcium ion transporter [Phialophora attinorum]KPI43817.1 Vacuolar calcium ion transporter [Phialophora attinorum]
MDARDGSASGTQNHTQDTCNDAESDDPDLAGEHRLDSAEWTDIGAQTKWPFHGLSRNLLSHASCFPSTPRQQAAYSPLAISDEATRRSRNHFFGSAISVCKDIFLSSWINLLLVFVPAGIAAGLRHAPPVLTFALNALAIVPLSSLLAYATECMASELGDSVGALLNISFGNIVEVVMFVVGLIHGEVKVVQGALVGSILVNTLLILGSAIICGDFLPQEMVYDRRNAQGLACLLSLAVFSFLLPTAFQFALENEEKRERGVRILSRGCAITLLVVYGLYLVFLLRPRNQRQAPDEGESFDQRASDSLIASLLPRTIRFADEHGSSHSTEAAKSTESIVLDDFQSDERNADPAAGTDEHQQDQDTGKKSSAHPAPGDRFGRASLSQPPSYIEGRSRPARSRGRSRSVSIQRRPRHSDIAERYGYSIDSIDRTPLQRLSGRSSFCSTAPDGPLRHVLSSIHSDDPPVIGRGTALALLITSSLLVAICADFLVGTNRSHHHPTLRAPPILSESLIGLIILPIGRQRRRAHYRRDRRPQGKTRSRDRCSPRQLDPDRAVCESADGDCGVGFGAG